MVLRCRRNRGRGFVLGTLGEVYRLPLSRLFLDERGFLVQVPIHYTNIFVLDKYKIEKLSKGDIFSPAISTADQAPTGGSENDVPILIVLAIVQSMHTVPSENMHITPNFDGFDSCRLPRRGNGKEYTIMSSKIICISQVRFSSL